MTEDRLQYIVSDNFATGEGRTISMMISLPYPTDEDYEVKPRITEDWQYIPGVLKNSLKIIAARRFVEKFGSWEAACAENLSREDFMSRYGHMVPDAVKKLSDPESKDLPPNIQWHQQLHFNFS